MQGLQVRHQIVNIVIGVLAEKVRVSVDWRVDLELHTFGWPRAIRAVGIDKRHGELVEIREHPGDCRSGGRSHGRTRFRMLWIQHLALEIKTLQPRGDAREIAGGGVAGSASAGTFEVFLASRDVPGLQVNSVDALASAFPGVRVLLLRVNKRHEFSDLLFGYIERRHSGLGTAVRHHRTDLISIHILADKWGAGEVGPGFSSAGIAAVAEGTIPAEEVGSLLDEIGIVGLGGGSSLLLCGKACRLRLSESKLLAREQESSQ